MLFVDKLTAISVARLFLLARKSDTVWYFDSLSRTAGVLLRVLRALRILRADVRRVTHNVADVESVNGEVETLEMYQQAHAISKVVRRDKLNTNFLINRMVSLWSRDEVILHFEKELEVIIRLECKRIALSNWLQRTQAPSPLHQSFLLIQSNPWRTYLMEHASDFDLQLITYPGLPSFRFLTTAASFGLMVMRRGRAMGLRGLKQRSAPPPVETDVPKSEPTKFESGPAIGIEYSYRKLSFDLAERSEFSWLMESGIPLSSVVVYKYQSRNQLDQQVSKQLAEHGVKLLGNGPGARKWLPTLSMLTALFTTGIHLLRAIVGTLIRLHPISPYYFIGLVSLAIRYSFWYDFYSTHRIKVCMLNPESEVAQVLALRALGGISAGSQRSVSNIVSPNTILTAGEDVQFVYSRKFEDLYRSIGSPTKNYIITGIKNGRGQEGANEHPEVIDAEKKLKAAGVEYTLSYFDENSINNWVIPASNESAANDYRFLLDWLLDDPTLGMIMKPKRGHDLFTRLDQIKPLIDQALATGRCVFLKSAHSVGNLYPASIARSSDLCVGILSGGTAAIECRTAGVPAVLVDSERYRGHPFWSLGAGSVVFADWPALRRAVELHRERPDTFKELGEWQDRINDFDPFLDGCADLRIGQYIQHLTQAMGNGGNKDEAIAEASRIYADQWGIQHLSNLETEPNGKNPLTPII